MNTIETMGVGEFNRELRDHTGERPAERSAPLRRTIVSVLATGVCYYLATEIARLLCFPDSKVSLFFPPYAVLVSILVLVPTRHWWAYILAAMAGHLVATQQAHWPLLYSLHCEIFDAVKNVSAAAGLRLFIKSPLKALTLRDAIVFLLVAVVIVSFGTALWGAALTIAHHYGTRFWVEWRNLGISNAVTAIVLVPAILLGGHHLFASRIKPTPARLWEAGFLGVGLLAVGYFAFGYEPAGPENSPAVLYTPIPFLIWAALRFGIGGTSLATLVITFQAIWGTMHLRGPFLTQTPVENALALQLFLLVTATPLLLLALVIDEERRSQSALRESEVRFRTVADSAPVLIWMSGTDKLVTFVNKGWLEFTGRTLEEELGGGWAEGIHRDDCEHCWEIYARAFEARQAFTIEYRLRRADGEFRWVFDNGAPRYAPDGAFLGYIGTCIDIAERKQAEREIAQQRAELSHLARVTLVGEMASSLAHELNQPLTAIVANAGAARRCLAHGEVNLEELQQTLADIGADGRRAGEVIRAIRGMVRKDESSRHVLDLNDVIADVLRMVRADAHAHDCALDTDLATSPSTVLGDAVQIQQVLLNLVLNAFDAMREMPRDSCRVEIRSRVFDADTIEVSVRDFGSGLPPEGPDRVFERFFSTKRDGMGMGLAIARSIIDAHGGRLDAENAAGGGARFWFHLPACRPDSAEAPKMDACTSPAFS